MKYMTANEAKSKFGQLLENCVREPVAVTKHGRRAAVVISDQEFTDYQALKLAQLKVAVDVGLQDIEAGRSSSYDRKGLQQLFKDIKSEGRKQKAR